MVKFINFGKKSITYLFLIMLFLVSLQLTESINFSSPEWETDLDYYSDYWIKTILIRGNKSKNFTITENLPSSHNISISPQTLYYLQEDNIVFFVNSLKYEIRGQPENNSQEVDEIFLKNFTGENETAKVIRKSSLQSYSYYWTKTVTLETNESGIENLTIREDIPDSENITVSPEMDFYLDNNAVVLVIESLNRSKRYLIKGYFEQAAQKVSDQIENTDDSFFHISTLENYSEFWIKNITIFSESGVLENITVKEKVPTTKNIFVNPDYSYTLQENIISVLIDQLNKTTSFQVRGDYNKPVKKSSGVFVDGYGDFGISAPANIESFDVDSDLNINFELSLLNGSKTSVRLELPFTLPEGFEIYLWKNVSGKTIRVPYNITKDRNTLELFLEDGVIDDDGVVDGKIVDPLKLFIPDYNVDINDIDDRTKQVVIDTRATKISTSDGKLDSVKVVDPDNLPDTPVDASRFQSKLLKFRITNITDTVDVFLDYNEPIKDSTLWKFNPNTLEWYKFPFERVDETTIKLTLADGGFGDDDGVRNGVIEDDLGLVIIPVTKATHLDTNRSFLQDVYGYVKELDGNWTPVISTGEYVRVKFEKNLTRENDITIFPKLLSQNATIEIYEADENKLIAEFDQLESTQYNKVFLDNLDRAQDTFDLKIYGSVQFDHIVDPWPNTTFERCINITIQSVGSSELTNFPAYINLSKHAEMQPDFVDLRFYNDTCDNGGSQLDYEIENYTTANAHIWVKIPRLKTGNTSISVYFMNSTGVSSGENPSGVWDSYHAVWHMTEQNVSDSTSNNYDGTNHSGVFFNSSGSVDGANYFNGSAYIGLPGFPNMQSDFTVEAWIKTFDNSENGQRIFCDDETNGGYALSLGDPGAGALRFFVRGLTPVSLDTSNVINNNQWYHVAGVGVPSSQDRYIYVNGVEEASDTSASGSWGTDSGEASIGGETDSGEDENRFVGIIDEVRISNVTRSQDWINQTYQMVANQNELVVYSTMLNISGILNITIDKPDNSDQYLRNTEFAMNGSVECSRGECGNITVYSQYYSTASPTESFTETSSSDFIDNTSSANLSISSGSVYLNGDTSAFSNWWDSGWNNRKEINITSIAELSDFPFYINISKENSMQNDFEDLRFINGSCDSPDTVQLSYEIEKYTSTNAHVWVKIPSLSAGKNPVCMYYGNDQVASGENATDVWESYHGVWHMTEANAIDSTGNSYDGVASTGVSFNSSGYIDGSNDFDGSGYIGVSGFPNLQSNFTIEAWIKTNDNSEQGQRIFCDDESNTGGYAMSLGDPGAGALRFYSRGMSGITLDTSNGVIANGQWYHVAGVADTTNQDRYVYVNAIQRASDTTDTGTWGTDSGQASIGGETASGETSNRFNGVLDEIRISDAVRSQDWINQTYQIVANQNNMVEFGSPQTVQYFDNAEYISGVFDSGFSTVEYKNISWVSTSNENTSLTFYTRTSAGSASAWWDPDWEYRKPINISNTGSQLDDYQVKISLNLTDEFNDGDLNANCTDVRFAFDDGGWIELDYWAEYCNTSGSNSTFWVNVPVISANDNTTIHLYYGNSDAQSASNGSAVFEFFDDFEGTDIDSSLWQIDTGNYSVSNSVLTMDNDSISVKDELSFNLNDGYILEGRILYHEILSAYSGTLSAQSDHYTEGGNGDGDATSLFMRESGSATVYRWTGSGSVVDDYNCGSGSIGWTSSNDVWYILGSKFNSSGVTHTRGRTTEYGPYGCGWTKNLTYVSLGYFDGQNVDMMDTSYDWVLVRKYAGQEPLITTGSETNYTSVSEDPGSMTWSSWYLQGTNNAEIEAPHRRYLQYKMLMSTSNSNQTPVLDEIEIEYKLVTDGWTTMQPTDTYFTTPSSYDCGDMEISECTYNLSIVPNQVGNYSLRNCVNSSDSEISLSCTEVRNISVWLQPLVEEFTASVDPVGKGKNTTLQMRLLDDAAVPMSGYNISFVDMTGNGSVPYSIGSDMTDSNGYASIEYNVPENSSLSSHTINASYSGAINNFLRSAAGTKSIVMSSTPSINNITKTPDNVGFGYDLIIRANVTDEKGLDKVYVNITEDGSTTAYEMQFESTDIYNYSYSDTWEVKDIDFVVWANNTDNIVTTSSQQSFSVEVYSNVTFQSDKDYYKSNENVYVDSTLGSWIYGGWEYRRTVTLSSSRNLSDHQIQIDLDNNNFDFSRASSNGSDIRFTYQNGTNETAIPFWLEEWNSTTEQAKIWTKVPLVDQNTILYMYYGNPSAETASDGKSTFVLFDHFNGSGLDTSLWYESANSYSVSNSILRVNIGGIGLQNPLSVDLRDGYIAETRSLFNTYSSGYSGTIPEISSERFTGSGNNNNAATTLYMRNNGGSREIHYWMANGTVNTYDIVNEGNAQIDTLENQWNITGVSVLDNETILWWDYKEVLSEETVYTEPINYTSLGSFQGSASSDIQDTSYDWIRVRKYSDTNPLVTVGSQENGLPGIRNTGTTDFKGYLKMLIQEYDGMSWNFITPGVVSSTLYNISAGNTLNLSRIWRSNDAWNTTDREPGQYRIYASMEDPDQDTLVDTAGNLIQGWYEFIIMEPVLVVTDLEYENQVENSINEYETGDVIDWINVTVKPINNTAFDTNVSLSVLDNTLSQVSWGPNSTQNCGDLNENEECEKRWDNSSSGYSIPLDASSGSYNFYWNVDMFSDNGQTQNNKSMYFTLHNIPETFTHTTTKTRLYKPTWSYYNFTFTNSWSENITDISLEINCPEIDGFECENVNTGTLIYTLSELENNTALTVSYNVSANESVTSDDYSVNITLNYTNPSDKKSWVEYETQMFEVRSLGILVLNITEYPVNVTRTGRYDFSVLVNNTGDTTANDVWLNYTLPGWWWNTTGPIDKYISSLGAGAETTTNITTEVGLNSSLGQQVVRVDSSANDGRNDWTTVDVYVYANTTLTVQSNVSWANQGTSIKLNATLVYDNGSVIEGENISFYDEFNDQYIGSDFTNSQGVAEVIYNISPTATRADHTLNATFAGDHPNYLWGSYATTSVEIKKAPTISDVSATPNTTGYGYNVTIQATVEDDDEPDVTRVYLTYPNSSEEVFEMDFSPPKTFSIIFNNTWQHGTYNYTIWSNDTDGSVSESSVHNFSVDVSANIKVKPVNDSYGSNQYVNLTDAVSSWWNPNWNYRKMVNITTDHNLSNHQVRVSVSMSQQYSNGKIKPYCQDVRFAYYNQSTGQESEVSHWTESCNLSDSGTAYFWANVPYIENNTIVYIYYGNDGASDASSGHQTFEFFDDFEGSALNTTVWDIDTSNYAVGNSTLRIDQDSIGLQNPFGFNILDNYTVNGRLMYHGTATGSTYSGTLSSQSSVYTDGNNGNSDATVLYMRCNGGSQSLCTWIDNGTDNQYDCESGATVWSSNDNQWYVLGERFTPTQVTLTRDWVTEYGPYQCEWVKDIRYVSLGYFNGYDTGDIQDTSYDWVLVRKNAPEEPTAQVSPEEHAGSVVLNSGQTNFTGYLVMKVQKNNSGTWQDVSTVVDDVTSQNPRTAEPDLNLSPIWNPVSWYTNAQDAGEYRIYAEMADPDGNVLYTNDGYLNSTYVFELSEPPLQISVDDIVFYDVTDAEESNREKYVNDYVDSGLNKTFNLFSNKIYRVEVVVNNIGSTVWNLNTTTARYHNLEPSWEIDEIDHVWYSNETGEDGRIDQRFEGGEWNGTIGWNTSHFKGTVQPGDNATFFYIFNSSSGDTQTTFMINHSTFTKSDSSIYHITVSDAQAPGLFNSEYGFTLENITRGGSTIAYARWTETITQANITYTTTSPSTWVKASNSSPQNALNYTNFTITTNSGWFLGEHQVKISARDESGNWNQTLPYINFSVFGNARLSTGNVNTSTPDVGHKVRIRCRVTDTTKSGDPISGYQVQFYNSTGEIGDSYTNSTGWAIYDYTDPSAGPETLYCNITSNHTAYYYRDSQYQQQFSITTIEYVNPYYTTISGPSVAHKGEYVDLKTLWHDNHLLDSAVLSINSSGNWTNQSTVDLQGTDSWANFSYQIPTDISPGKIEWRQYGNDSSGNTNMTPVQSIQVWGYSEVAETYVSPASIQIGNMTTAYCRVKDANHTNNLTNYNVTFWIKNSTSDYTLLSENITDTDGYSSIVFNQSYSDTFTLKCNITDDEVLKYNSSSQNYQTDTLNVVSGEDAIPPASLPGTYTLNDTEIYLGQCVQISAQWNEAIDHAWARYDPTVSSYINKNLTPPYTLNWTNMSICTNSSWEPGNHSVKLFAKDSAGNTNNSLTYKSFVVWGRSQLSWQNPTSDMDRGNITLSCRVTDQYTGEGLQGYNVTFWDGDEGRNMGTVTTNASGVANITDDFYDYKVGPIEFSCVIDDEGYYKVTGAKTKYQTIDLYGYLYPNITTPENNSIMYAGQSNSLQSDVVDELGNAPLNQFGGSPSISETWYNSTFDQIATGEDTTWNTPADYGLGPEKIHLNMTSMYYHEGTTSADVDIYSYANVSMVTPDEKPYTSDTQLNLTCLVSDTQSQEPVSGYWVEFFRNNTFLSLQSTNSSGHARYQVNSNTFAEGSYRIRCTINDSDTLYYNRSAVYEDYSDISIDKTYPSIFYNPTTDTNGSYSRDNIFINISADDQNLDTVLLYWDGNPEQFTNTSGNLYWINKSGLADNTYEFYAWVNDTAGNVNQTPTRQVTVDTQYPVITTISPINESYYSSAEIDFNVSLNENADWCGYELDNNPNVTMTKENSTYLYNTTTVSQGQHNVTFFCNDSVGNMQSESVEFSVDTDSPDITLNSPTDNKNTTDTNIFLNCSVSDNYQITNVSLYGSWSGWGEKQINTSGVNGTDYIFNQTLSEGTYTWNCRACDGADCSFAADNFTFTIDTTPPVISVQSPQDKAYNYTSIDINFTAADDHREECWYYNGTQNVTLPGCSNTTADFSEGNHTIIIYANDSASNVDSQEVNFSVDLTKPQLQLASPAHENRYEDTSDIDLNYSVSDNLELDKCYRVLNSNPKQEISGCQNTTLNGLSNQNHSLTLYVNDTAGNTNSTTIWFIVNVTELVVTPQNPENSSYINTTSVWANATTNKGAVGCNVSLDSGANQTMANSTEINWYKNIDPVSEGSHDLRFFCRDQEGNITSSDFVYFTVDTTEPSLDVDSPVQNNKYQTTTIDINYSASDLYAINCSRSVDGGAFVDIGCSNTSVVLGQGEHNITIKVTDQAGNTNLSVVDFVVDTVAPEISIISPRNQTYTYSTLDFNVSSTEILSQCWYSLDSAENKSMTEINNTYFANTTQVADSQHTIEFYCNDTAGNTGTNSTEFTVDTTGPQVTFISPDDEDAIGTNYTLVNITTNEPATEVLLEWNYSNGTVKNISMNSMSQTNWWYNMTGLADTTHYYRVHSNDTYDNWARTPVRSLTVSTGVPIIYVDSPENVTYNTSVVDLNIYSNREIESWWYIFNNRNFSLTPNTTLAADIGSNTVTVYARDVAGNVGNTTVSFSTNITIWSDSFKSFTGLNTSDNLSIYENATASMCWSEVSSENELDNPVCYPYRKQIIVNTTSSHTNYQVRLTLDIESLKSAGKIRSDCADIRFNYLDTSEESADYWIEECGNSTQNASIWVEVPSITSSGEILYMYYGSNTSTSQSSGEDVFLFFDDFSSVNQSVWGTNAQNWETQSGEAYPTASGSSSKLESTYTFPDSYATELRFRANSTADTSGYYRMGDGSGTKNHRLYLDSTTNQINWYNGGDNTHSVSSGSYHTYSITTDYDSNDYDLYVDHETSPSISLGSADTGGNTHLVFYSYYSGGLYVDWVAVRKYSSTQPFIQSIGAESEASGNASLKSIFIAPDTLYEWDKFYAKTATPAGTSISFNILNQSGNNLCTITSAQADSGHDVCQNAQSFDELYLYAEFTSDEDTPTLFSWNISWNALANIKISVANSTGEISNALVELTDSESQSQSDYGTLQAAVDIDDYYTFKTQVPATNMLKTHFSNVLFSNNNTVEQQVIDYSGDMPQDIDQLTPVVAMNTTSFEFDEAKLTIPKNGVDVDKILKCSNWDFEEYNCSDWQQNETTHYDHYGSNSTHIWFNVTEFSAYAGGEESSVAQSDLEVEEITFSDNTPSENRNITVYVNVSNSGVGAAENFTVQLNISMWNGTWNLNRTLNHGTYDLDPDETMLVSFTHIIDSGTTLFSAYADSLDNVSETNEDNNDNSVNLSVSAWHTFYGSFNYSMVLRNINNNSFITWEVVNKSNIYFYDTDSSFVASDLMPLNNTNDLSEADSALGMTGFNDSIENLFDPNDNGVSDYTHDIKISGTTIENIPVIRSTNTWSFITGLLYDTADGGSQYNGSQDLVIITQVNMSKAGKYGTYDYEVRLPSGLKSMKGSINSVTRLDELA